MSARAECLSLLAVSSAFAAQLSLPQPFAVPGSTLALPVLFVSQADSVSTLQFDLVYDPSAISLSATVGDAARGSGKTLSSSDVAPNRKRFLVAGLNQTPLADGPLLNLFVTLAPNTTDGVYPLKFSGLMTADADANPSVPDSVDGAILLYQSLGAPVPLQAEDVLNGASLLPGPVAPGEVIRVIGSGLAGAGLLFDGTPAQVLSVSPTQIDAIVPSTLAGKMTQLQVMLQGQAIAEVLLPVEPTSPAIFTADGGGAGQGAILNEDLTFNSASNPAARGSIITIPATGLGQAGATLSVQIGGLVSPVLYMETAPDSNPGVLLVKCTVPDQAPIGYTVPVFLISGQTGSQTGVTLAIE